MDFIFYLSLFCLILIFGTLDNNIDFDFWARLIVGKSFFQTGTLFNNDFYSFGTTHEFIDHEWGSSLIFYLIQHHFSDIGLYFFKSIIIFLTIFLLIKTIRLENKNAKLHFLFFFFAIQSISYNIFSTVRCQTFSFLLFAFYLYILKYAKIKNNYKILWTLPVLNIIWANLHGGFTIGLIVIFLFALGEFLNKKTFKPYAVCFILCCLTSLINPYGYKYIVFIFEALALHRKYITEWQSAFFSKIYYYSLLKYKLYFIPIIPIFLYSIIKSIKNLGLKEYYSKIDKTKYLIIIFFLLISLKSLRFHVFFVYSIIAFCYNDFYAIFNKKLPKTIDNTKEILLCALMIISTISHIYIFQFANQVKDSQYPVQCVEFIKQNNLKGNILTNFHTGNYVAYKLYPNNHVFMDGRYEEVYDVNLVNELASLFLAQNYQSFLQKYHCDILILDNYYQISKVLKNDPNWLLAHSDKHFSLFLNKKTFKNNKYIKPIEDENYYNKTKFQTSINWLKHS